MDIPVAITKCAMVPWILPHIALYIHISGTLPRVLGCPQEVSKRLGSVGYNPNIPHLQVGYKPFTNHLKISWNIQVPNFSLCHSFSQGENVFCVPPGFPDGV